MSHSLASFDANEWENIASISEGGDSACSSATSDCLRDRVILNVGGRTFETLSSTLQESHRLREVVSKGRCRLGGEKEIFIDGDPDLFGDILDFLRRVCIPPTFIVHFLLHWFTLVPKQTARLYAENRQNVAVL